MGFVAHDLLHAPPLLEVGRLAGHIRVTRPPVCWARRWQSAGPRRIPACCRSRPGICGARGCGLLMGERLSFPVISSPLAGLEPAIQLSIRRHEVGRAGQARPWRNGSGLQLALEAVEQLQRLLGRQGVGLDVSSARLPPRWFSDGGGGGGREQRQLINPGQRLVPFTAFFQRPQAPTRRDESPRRQARQLGDMDAIGTVGGARRRLHAGRRCCHSIPSPSW